MAGLFQGCRNSRRSSRRVSFLFYVDMFMVLNIVITKAEVELQHRLLLSTLVLVVSQLPLMDLSLQVLCSRKVCC